MTTRSFLMTLTLASLLSGSAFAAPMSATQRYEADKRLCGEEQSSTNRMQCLRDARAEYDRAQGDSSARSRDSQSSNAACKSCGKVTSVRQLKKEGEGSALGVVGGGVVGGLLGNQVGSGHGRQLATIAGAAGGAYAGNRVEKNMKSSTYWSVGVQYEDGRKRSFDFAQNPGLQSGDRVVNKENSIVRR